MHCHQCPRPALYLVTEQEIPLCLVCYEKWQTIQNVQFLQNAAMLNQALDDMDTISGISLGGGRIPVSAIAKAMQNKPTFNNISVTNSNVGVINTGDLAKIDAAITITDGTDVAEIGQLFRHLTQAVIDSTELSASTKKEMAELIHALSDQIVGGRKKSIISSLIRSLEERAKGANAIIQLIGSLTAAIGQLFGNSTQ